MPLGIFSKQKFKLKSKTHENGDKTMTDEETKSEVEQVEQESSPEAAESSSESFLLDDSAEQQEKEEPVSEADSEDSDEKEFDEVSQGEEDPFLLDDVEEDEHIEEKLPWSSRIKSTKEFFNTEILYRYDILEEQVRSSIEGSYRIELEGSDKDTWSLKLGLSLDVSNKKEDADIVLNISERDFLNLINGELNPQIAILAEKLKVTGDLSKALAFQNVLAPSTS